MQLQGSLQELVSLSRPSLYRHGAGLVAGSATKWVSSAISTHRHSRTTQQTDVGLEGRNFSVELSVALYGIHSNPPSFPWLGCPELGLLSAPVSAWLGRPSPSHTHPCLGHMILPRVCQTWFPCQGYLARAMHLLALSFFL